MARFTALKAPHDFEIGEHVDVLGRVWWLYRCAVCDHEVQTGSAIHGDLEIREHILNHHSEEEPPC